MTDELDKQLDMIDFVSTMRVQNEVPGYGSERIVEIRLKLEDKAKQAIQKECTKARIDELEHLFDRADGERSARRYTAILEQRIKVLRTRLNGVKK